MTASSMLFFIGNFKYIYKILFSFFYSKSCHVLLYMIHVSFMNILTNILHNRILPQDRKETTHVRVQGTTSRSNTNFNHNYAFPFPIDDMEESYYYCTTWLMVVCFRIGISFMTVQEI